MYLIIAAFGLGLSYIGKNNIIAIVFSLAAILFFIVSILIIRCCTKKQRISENQDSEEEKHKQKKPVANKRIFTISYQHKISIYDM